MTTSTKSTTIRFDKSVLDLVHKQATLDGESPTEYMRDAVLEKLADSFDYQDAIRNMQASHGKTVSRDDVKKQLGL